MDNARDQYSGMADDYGVTEQTGTGTGDNVSATRTLPEVKAQAQAKTEEVLDQAQARVGEVADQVKQQGTTQLNSQKERAAEQLTGVSQALRQTGQQLRYENPEGPVAQYAEKAAEQVERLSSYLQQHEIGDMVGDIERFARRQPALFLSGAFALGVIAARFIKSSSSADRQGQYSGYSGYPRYSNYSGEGGYSGSSRYGSGADYRSGAGYGYRAATATGGTNVGTGYDNGTGTGDGSDGSTGGVGSYATDTDATGYTGNYGQGAYTGSAGTEDRNG